MAGQVSAMAIFVCGLFLAIPALAEVGASYESYKSSDFNTFFNLSETGREKEGDKTILLKLKTGGFQEFVDVSIRLDSSDKVVQATLYVERSWLGGKYQTFARDILKSFISQFVASKDRPLTEPLVKVLFENPVGDPATSSLDDDSIKFLGVVLGKSTRHERVMSQCSLLLQDKSISGKTWLSVQVTLSGYTPMKQEEPVKEAPQVDTWLTEKEMAQFGLSIQQDSPELKLKAWMSGDPQSPFFRVVDIRWTFGTEEEARRFHLENLATNSEGASPVANPGFEPFGQELRVYKMDSDDGLAGAFGLEMPMYYFLFHQGRFVAKVFVAGNKGLMLDKAAEIGRAAHALMKKKLEKQQDPAQPADSKPIE